MHCPTSPNADRFDGSVISNELRRAGLEEDVEAWDWAITTGMCTMDPEIGRWVCQCFGKDTGSKNTKVTLKLDDLAGMLWKRQFLDEEPKGPRHTAGRDADLHRAAYVALQRLCRLCS